MVYSMRGMLGVPLLALLALLLALAGCAHSLDQGSGDAALPGQDAAQANDGAAGGPDATADGSQEASSEAGGDDGGTDSAATNVPIGSPCATTAQCDAGVCQPVHNGDAATPLCVKVYCSPFSMCPLGSTCYADTMANVCVGDCTASPTCPQGLTCLTTFAPSKGCLPQ